MVEINIERIVCIECGVLFWISNDMYRTLEKSKRNFYCPNGHGQHFTGATDKETIKRLREDIEQSNVYYEEEYDKNEELEKELKKAEKAAAAKKKEFFEKLELLTKELKEAKKAREEKKPKSTEEVIKETEEIIDLEIKEIEDSESGTTMLDTGTKPIDTGTINWDERFEKTFEYFEKHQCGINTAYLAAIGKHIEGKSRERFKEWCKKKGIDIWSFSWMKKYKNVGKHGKQGRKKESVIKKKKKAIDYFPEIKAAMDKDSNISFSNAHKKITKKKNTPGSLYAVFYKWLQDKGFKVSFYKGRYNPQKTRGKYKTGKKTPQEELKPFEQILKLMDKNPEKTLSQAYTEVKGIVIGSLSRHRFYTWCKNMKIDLEKYRKSGQIKKSVVDEYKSKEELKEQYAEENKKIKEWKPEEEPEPLVSSTCMGCGKTFPGIGDFCKDCKEQQ